MGNVYQPNVNWTSALRSKAGHQPYSASIDDASTFTIIDTDDRLQNFLLQYDRKNAQPISTHTVFHLQVAVSYGPFCSSFKLESNHVRKVKSTPRSFSSSL